MRIETLVIYYIGMYIYTFITLIDNIWNFWGHRNSSNKDRIPS